MTTDRNLLTRRGLLRTGALASGALALGPSFWTRAVASAAIPTEGPYGPLRPADANGIRLPAGFRSRVIARAKEVVPGTRYRYPVFPDGQATFGTRDGGFILVTNAEARAPHGGVSAIRFAADGTMTDAYRILSATRQNCAGGPTPWGTWLSCEEFDDQGGARGAVWECDPTAMSQGVRRPALGLFSHEAVAVDSVGQRLYLTEDHGDSNLYRFTPDAYPLLTSGLLETAVVAADGRVTWVAVPNPQPGPGETPTRSQVPTAAKFRRAEGIWFDSGVVYVATTSDSRIHAYDTRTETIEVIYDKARLAGDGAAILTDVDNIIVSPSGDLFACEDSGDDGMDVALLTPDLTISRFASLVGDLHAGSEVTGPVFDPSGRRLFLTSQRARVASGRFGAVYEITGPFRLDRPRRGPIAPGGRRVARVREPGQAVGSGQGASRAVAPLAGSALGIEVPRRVAWSASRTRGIPVALTLDAPATVDVVVRARWPRVTRRERRRGRLRRASTLARSRRRLARGGPQTLFVALGRDARRRLRDRRLPLRVLLDVRLTDADGRPESVRRTTLLTAPPRRRSAARH